MFVTEGVNVPIKKIAKDISKKMSKIYGGIIDIWEIFGLGGYELEEFSTDQGDFIRFVTHETEYDPEEEETYLEREILGVCPINDMQKFKPNKYAFDSEKLAERIKKSGIKSPLDVFGGAENYLREVKEKG